MISVVSLIISFLGIVTMLIMGLLVSRYNAKTKYNMEKELKTLTTKRLLMSGYFCKF
jgi:NADPH-dependent curcumin reductase CurA